MAKVLINGNEYQGNKIEIKEGTIYIDGKKFGIVYGKVGVVVIEGNEEYNDGNIIVK